MIQQVKSKEWKTYTMKTLIKRKLESKYTSEQKKYDQGQRVTCIIIKGQFIKRHTYPKREYITQQSFKTQKVKWTELKGEM